MLTIDAALEKILSAVASLPPERVGVLDAAGRVLAEPFQARFDLPPVDNSAMDGWALRAADVAAATEAEPVRLAVIGEIPAGGRGDLVVGPGEAARIFTGAPVPEGADAVVMQERTRAEPGVVLVQAAVREGENVRPRGDDVRAGTPLLEAGAVLGPAEVAALVAHGRTQVAVHRRPRVAVFSTGDELVPPDGDFTGGGAIVDSNGYALVSACRAAGAEATLLGTAPDDPEAIAAMVAAARPFDVLLTSGGVSVGDRDHVRPVLEAAGLEGGFWKVAMKPGKPLLFGRLHGRPVFGLPGNPVSALVGFHLFVDPALRRLFGRGDPRPPMVRARLVEEAPAAKGRTNVLWVRLSPREGGGYEATPLGRQASHRIGATLGAHGLLQVPPDSPLPAGAEAAVQVVRLPGSGG